MIRNFRCKETKRIWDGFRSDKLPFQIQKVARRKLRMIHSALDINDLRIPPSNHLEKLKGDLTGYYSIRINRQWRIVFCFESGYATEVQIIDYH